MKSQSTKRINTKIPFNKDSIASNYSLYCLTIIYNTPILPYTRYFSHFDTSLPLVEQKSSSN